MGLLGVVRRLIQVAHMSQALCLVVTSSVAVKVLRTTGWDWDRAVSRFAPPFPSNIYSFLGRSAEWCIGRAAARWYDGPG